MPERLPKNPEDVVLRADDPALQDDGNARRDIQRDNGTAQWLASRERGDPTSHNKDRLRGGTGGATSDSGDAYGTADTFVVVIGIRHGPSRWRKSNDPPIPPHYNFL